MASGPSSSAYASSKRLDRKSTRLNSSHSQISYAVFCLKKKKRVTNLPRAPVHFHAPAPAQDLNWHSPLTVTGMIRTNAPMMTSDEFSDACARARGTQEI